MFCRSIKRRRKESGITIAEAAGMMALFLPLLMIMLYVMMETCQAYFISNSMDQAARQAARNIAMYYHTNPGIQNNNTQCLTLCCQPVCKAPGTAGAMVTDVSQFGGAGGAGTAITWTNMGNMNQQNQTSPPTVTVTCTYISNGTTQLPPFPIWDVLNLKKVANFKLMGTAVYQVQ